MKQATAECSLDSSSSHPYTLLTREIPYLTQFLSIDNPTSLANHDLAPNATSLTSASPASSTFYDQHPIPSRPNDNRTNAHPLHSPLTSTYNTNTPTPFTTTDHENTKKNQVRKTQTGKEGAK